MPKISVDWLIVFIINFYIEIYNKVDVQKLIDFEQLLLF